MKQPNKIERVAMTSFAALVIALAPARRPDGYVVCLLGVYGPCLTIGDDDGPVAPKEVKPKKIEPIKCHTDGNGWPAGRYGHAKRTGEPL